MKTKPVPPPPGWRPPSDDELRKARDPAGPLAYLRPLHDRVILAALMYVIDNPRGDEVSLAVLNALERSEVEALAGRGKKLSRLIRDCENLIVALLAGVMGWASVFVGPSRDKSRVSGSVYWPAAWADTYRAIRVAVPSPQPERIHFDTVVVRHVISDDRRAIDLSRLAKSKGGHWCSPLKNRTT